MRRFRFRLEKLLALRRYAEREWEIRLGQATAVVLATKASIAGAEDGIARSFGFPGAPSGGVTLEASAVVWAERYRQGMAARLQWLEGELAVQEAELEKVRLGYLEASRRRKVMDKLKERQSDAARRAATREEIAVLNDIATSRSVRWGEPAAEDRQ